MNAGKSARAPLSFVFTHPRYVTSVWRILPDLDLGGTALYTKYQLRV